MKDKNRLRLFPRLHLFFAADDVAGVDAAADFIDHNAEATDGAFVGIALLNRFC